MPSRVGSEVELAAGECLVLHDDRDVVHAVRVRQIDHVGSRVVER